MNSWCVWSHRDGHGPDQVFKRSVLVFVADATFRLAMSVCFNNKMEMWTIFQYSTLVVLVKL